MKTDWDALKLEYIGGEFATVAGFLRAKALPNNQHSRHKTHGWRGERDTYQNNLRAAALKKAGNKAAEEMAKSLNNVRLAIAKYADPKNLFDEKGESRISATDLQRIWTMVRVENGLSPTVAAPLEVDEDDTVSPEDLTMIKQALKQLNGGKETDAN